MNLKNNVLIYFECENGLIISKLAKNSLFKTTSLKNVSTNILDNIGLDNLKKYIQENQIQIIFFITNKKDNIKLLRKDKSIRVIYINLNDYLKNPSKY